jgi:hypothetical protein
LCIFPRDLALLAGTTRSTARLTILQRFARGTWIGNPGLATVTMLAEDAPVNRAVRSDA